MIKKVRQIENGKKTLGLLPTIQVPPPPIIYLAVTNARAGKGEIYVKPGERVLMGQVIGKRSGPFFEQNIHSTVSGTVKGYSKHYHRSGKEVEFLEIANDYLDEKVPSIHDRSEEEIASLTQEEIVEIAKETSLVGLGGSSFPTYIKLASKNQIHTLVINGVECEPFISADHRYMLENPLKVLEGCRILQRCFNCHNLIIGIKKKYKDIETVYQEVLRRYDKQGIRLMKVGNFYPQGWENALIKATTGIQIEAGKRPLDYGVLEFNVSTTAGLYEAVKHNEPVFERYVSFAGDGLKYPSNLKVRIGTPIRYILPYCGGYKDETTPKVFILGGPMMGASLPSDDAIFTKTVTSILVLEKKENKEETCIRCGSCVLSCPTGLNPAQIMRAVKSANRARVKALHPEKCIECGLCTYACTSHLSVTDYVRRGKLLAKL